MKPVPRPLILVLFLICCCGQAWAAEKPNILLIFTDDLGWKDVAFHNDGGFIETPHLDKLRAQGMVFPQAYAAAANCAPSRACLLSGKYTPRHGVYAVGNTARGPAGLFRLTPVPNTAQLKPEFVTIAEALKSQGYATGHFGKWHLGSDAKNTGPRQQGFDVSPPDLVSPGGAEGEEEEAQKKRSDADPENPKKIQSITDAASAFISANKTRPFFAFVAHHAVHSALAARPATLAHFQEKAESAPAPHVPALLAACIADMDDGVGQLMKKLEAEGLTENTLVIFTSDNGGPPPADNEPLRGAKGGYYEGGIREPFLVRWPGRVKPGSICDVPIIHTDLYPTFVSAAGGQPAADLDGVNLLPLMTGAPATDPRPALFWHFPGYLNKPVNRGRDPVFRTRPVSVIRKGDWKLHLYHEEWLLDGGRGALDTSKATELYHLTEDPGEHTDLSVKEPAKRDELLADLLAWIEKTHAPFPTPK